MTYPELTLSGLEAWLKTQDPATEYVYTDNGDCLVARFAKSLGYPDDTCVIPGSLAAGGERIRYDLALDRAGANYFAPDDRWNYGAALSRIQLEKTRPVEADTDLMELKDWTESVRAGHFNDMDGSGRWVREGYYMTSDIWDDVFDPLPPAGATHVAWFNK